MINFIKHNWRYNKMVLIWLPIIIISTPLAFIRTTLYISELFREGSEVYGHWYFHIFVIVIITFISTIELFPGWPKEDDYKPKRVKIYGVKIDSQKWLKKGNFNFIAFFGSIGYVTTMAFYTILEIQLKSSSLTNIDYYDTFLFLGAIGGSILASKNYWRKCIEYENELIKFNKSIQ